MEFIHGHIYLIKDTMNEFSQLDITGKEYRLMVVPSDCKQLCHVSKEDIATILQRRDCSICQIKTCKKSSIFNCRKNLTNQ